jgi:hypothetical protein
MRQTSFCPNCGASVTPGYRFCGTCGLQLNWPTQQTQPPPVYQQQGYYGYKQQTPQPKKTNPLLIGVVALIAIVLLVVGGVFIFGRLSQGTPSTTTPPAGSTPTSDTIAPVITNVSFSPAETSAVITWVTNEPSSSQVEYGRTTNYGSHSALEQALVLTHSVTLSSLEPNTTYHFRVKSKDSSGNEAIFEDKSLTTLADTVPPVISAVNASAITGSAATITWTTDELATSQVEYGKTTSYGSSTAPGETLITNHSVILTGLASETSYHFRVSSADKAGNKALSNDYTFTTGEAFSTLLHSSITIGSYVHALQFGFYNGSAETITVTKVEFFDEHAAVVHTISGSDLTGLWGNGQVAAGNSLSGGLSFRTPYSVEEIKKWTVKWHCLDAQGTPFNVTGEYSTLPSASATLPPLDTTPYYGVQLLSPNNGGMGIPVKPVSFSWSPFKETTKYKFVLAKDAAMTQIVKEADVTTTAYECDGTLDYSTNYFWRVMAIEPAPSDWSAVFSFLTEAAPR